MFNDIGKKIKGLCKIVFFVVLIIVAIIGIVVCVGLDSGKGVLMMFLIWGIGALIAYLLVLFLYAFGELVDTNSTIVKQNEKIIKIMSKDEEKGEEKPDSLVKYFEEK